MARLISLRPLEEHMELIRRLTLSARLHYWQHKVVAEKDDPAYEIEAAKAHIRGCNVCQAAAELEKSSSKFEVKP